MLGSNISLSESCCYATVHIHLWGDFFLTIKPSISLPVFPLVSSTYTLQQTTQMSDSNGGFFFPVRESLSSPPVYAQSISTEFFF